MNNVTLPIINKTKLLGTIITDDLKWNANTDELVKKGNQRMLLLRKSAEFTKSVLDLKTIYLSYVRNLVEQSSVLWGSTLTEENKQDNKKTRNLFPLRKKIHKFKTRKEDKFKNFKSKKKRLQTSTIPFLRKLLNEDNFKDIN